jgi:hypothetical protein
MESRHKAIRYKSALAPIALIKRSILRIRIKT